MCSFSLYSSKSCSQQLCEKQEIPGCEALVASSLSDIIQCKHCWLFITHRGWFLMIQQHHIRILRSMTWYLMD